MPPAMVADTVEHGLLEDLGDDTALYMSIYFFIQKLAAAFGVGIALPLAASLGFDPQAGGLADDTFGIRFVANHAAHTVGPARRIPVVQLSHRRGAA